MDFIKDKLSSIGAILAIFGLMSIILYFLDYNLRLLIWIDNWGETVGWIIRIGLIVVGAVLFFLTGSSNDEVEES